MKDTTPFSFLGFRLFLSLVTALFATAVRGTEITADQAAGAVQAWIDEGSSMGRLAGAEVDSSVTAETPSGSRIHVVKLAGGGFVITSADDHVDPVIAFAPVGTNFVQDASNPFWALISGDIAARERAAGVTASPTLRSTKASDSKGDAPTPAQTRWAALLEKAATKKTGAILRGTKSTRSAGTVSDIRVDSFVQSQWGQSTHNNYDDGFPCYNYYTPNGYPCGCVATAGAQLMRYWQWPTNSVTALTRYCEVDDESALYTMQGGFYDWASMPLAPANGATEVQRQAIGKLTYDIGVSVNMAWAGYGSGANPFALVPRLTGTFGYANAAAAVYQSNIYPYSLSELKKVVIPNCDVRAPLAMSIEVISDGITYGHAVIVDGYGYAGNDFYMHVNFGWGGYDDAWYMPPDIGDFDTIKGFVFNVFPQRTGSILSGRVLDAGGAPIANVPVHLAQGSATVASTTSDANGIYAFIASAGSYVVTADYCVGGVAVSTAAVSVQLASTTGTRLNNSGSWYTTSAASIGNSYGNDIAITGVAAVTPPVFSPESCLFYPTTNVTITCADADAAIRYTLNGTIPDETSSLYTGPILVANTVTIRARAFASGKNPSAVVGATYTYDAAAGAPQGDYYDDPIDISGASGTRVIDDNSPYTVEDGEPWHTLDDDGAYYQYYTVWYRWTAPGSGTMTFQTSSQGNGWIYPTFLAVYTGDTLASATRLAYAAEWDNNGVTFLSMSVEQGATYHIVGMAADDTYIGTFTLSWSGDLTISQLEQCATPVFSPDSCLFHPSTNVTITCADADAEIRYTLDDSEPAATSMLYAGPISVGSTVTIKARAFQNGKIPSPVATATYTYDVSVDAPQGDYFANPIPLSGASGTYDVDDNTDFTLEPGEPQHTSSSQYRTIWYQWTAPASGELSLEASCHHASGSATWYSKTHVAIYTGDTLSSAQRLAFSTGDSAYSSSLTLSVQQGVTYRIVGMMCASSGTGTFTLSWNGPAPPAETSTTPVPIPYSWLDDAYPNQAANAEAYETLAFSDTDGDGFPSWAEYVANTDPTNAASRLFCGISIGANGVPVITVHPETARDGFPRILQGKTSLTDNWVDISAPVKTFHFYRVRIPVGE